MLYAFFWVIPRRLNFVFRNVGIQNSEAWELPRSKHTTRVELFHADRQTDIADRLYEANNHFSKFFGSA